MKKNLLTAGSVGFLVGIGVGLFAVEPPLLDAVIIYIVSLLRYGVVFSLVGLFLGWNVAKRNQEKKNGTYRKGHYIGVFVATFTIVMVVAVLAWL
ncbi:hypothetical protein [Mangrovibacillus cuniculi]|uniref:Uncharacterized protein n=1 Tax=Mangrovibacillus cuniculi TaxID=2593652 RepID=A0A7S8CDX1_9BACI|nr:hypothetical protein [Mangrovibacillus cuniculi]QPC48101.1 hypothetical protein G8O30_14775 [Mangrovibacillus cuniculi]